MSYISHKSYLGTCTFAGKSMFCTNMSASIEAKPTFFDHVVGLRDTDSGSKGKGNLQKTQKRIYRYSPVLAKMSMSGPATSEGLKVLFDAAKKGDEIDCEMLFWKGGQGYKITKGIVSSFGMEIKAGEAVTFNAEIVGKDMSEDAIDSPAICTKIMVWTDVRIKTILGANLVSFSLNINNPIKPVWTSGDGEGTVGVEPKLFPSDLRIGIQEVTGSVTSYSANLWEGEDRIEISEACDEGIQANINVVYEGSANNGDGGGIFASTTSFQGHSESTSVFE
jgi:hypothetical protein